MTAATFRVLGPLAVDGPRGRVDIGTGLPAALLLRLLSDAGTVVSTERLLEDVWEGAPPPSGAAALRPVLSRLRRALADGDVDAPIVARSPGYVLGVEQEAIDATRFRALAQRGRDALAAGRTGEATEVLADALSLWRGPPYADAAYADWAVAEARRLEELRLSVTEDLLDARLSNGEHEAVIAELEPLLVAHPLRERLWKLRMLALYRVGRQADALRAYQKLREQLADGLGLDPSPDVQELEAAILRQDPALRGSPAGEQRPALPAGTVALLMTDVARSTELWEDHPAAMAKALARHDRDIREVVERHDGVVIGERGEGDSTFNVFPTTAGALAAAIDVQRAFPAGPDPVGLRVRSVVYTAEMHPHHGVYRGPAANRAGRMRDLAAPGQVLVSESTARVAADVLPDGATLRLLGAFALKGVAEPEPVYQLCHPEIDDEFPLPITARPGGNLGADAAPFVGRARETQRLLQLLAVNRLVSVVGPGGAGKTRLARHAARAANPAGAAWFVALGDLPAGSDPASVTAAFPSVWKDGPPPGALVVVDNAEHVRAGCGRAVLDLLAAHPSVRVITTTREALGVPGEALVDIGGLAARGDTGQPSEAAELFLTRATAVRAGFAPTADDLATIEGIGQLLDGLPLAIELAAARLRHMQLDDLHRRLADALGVLRGTDPTAPARHATLEAAIDWSYDLLDDDERGSFRRLGVLRGFGLPVAEAVIGSPDAADLVGRLVEKSLVTFDPAAEPSYRMLHVIREYALRRLADAGEERDALDALTSWSASFVEEVFAEVGGDAAAFVGRVGREIANLVPALTHAIASGPPATVNSLGDRLGWWWELSRRVNGGADLVAAAAGREDLAEQERAVLLLRAANLHVVNDDLGRAEDLLLDGEMLARTALAEEPTDRGHMVLATVLTSLADIALRSGDSDRAEDLARESLDLRRRVRSERGVARSLELLGLISSRRGELAPARTAFAEAIELGRRNDDTALVAGCLQKLGLAEARAGEEDQARGHLEEAVDLLLTISAVTAAVAATEAAEAAATAGWPDAAALRDRALELATATDDEGVHAWAERTLLPAGPARPAGEAAEAGEAG